MLNNKIVFITGASSGIGAACAEKFAEAGANIILTARRQERIKALAIELANKYHVQCLPLTLDVRDAKQIDKLINELPAKWQAIDVLINNAGLALTSDKFQNGDINNWDTMIDTNIKGLLYINRAILSGMLARNRGHIIHIGSIAGHEVYEGGNIYCATKYAVKAITKAMLIDLLGTPVRVSSIDPGAVETEFSAVRWNDAEKAKNFYANFKALSSADIANAAVFCAAQPAHVNIAEMIVLPVDQASVNHIHRPSTVAESFDKADV